VETGLHPARQEAIMGAWNTAIFGDDDACDLRSHLRIDRDL
jgi:hypothetical protein